VAMNDEKKTDESAPAITLGDITLSYGRYASVYDLLFGWVLQDGRNRLLAAVNEFQPKSILEMGVGTGLLLPHYPKHSAVVGVDISSEMLAKAKNRVAQLSLKNISLQQQNCEQLTFPDHAFDCVVLPYVLSVTPHPQHLIQESLRVCRPGGRIVIVNHFSGSRFWSWIERLVSPLAARIGFRSTFSYDEVLTPHRLKIERVENANLFGLSKVVVVDAVQCVWSQNSLLQQPKSTPHA